VIRIDDDERMPLTAEDRSLVLDKMEKAAEWAEALIVSDYGYGVVDQLTWNLALRLAAEQNIPLVLDSRYNLAQWQGATLVTPNEEEALALAGWDGISPYNINDIGAILREKTCSQNVIVTRGNEGMVLFQVGFGPFHLPIFGSDECTDVTGAGDTVVATATLALAGGATPAGAMALSNLAGALVVMKLGTATVTQEEMKQNLSMVGTPW
jgi:rfaE bifunctional protein kinase chain/domain